MQLQSGLVDANFCPLCSFWSMNNEMLNNHVRKHYRMGLTCHADEFTMASVAVMKGHMEMEHGYKGKRSGQAKKAKGKGYAAPSRALLPPLGPFTTFRGPPLYAC